MGQTVPNNRVHNRDAYIFYPATTDNSSAQGMWHEAAQLLDVSADFGQLSRPKASDLPQIVPHFFVPPLEDKPQNPILEALNLENINSNLPPRRFKPHLLPQELAALSLNVSEVNEQEPETKIEEIWKNALIRRRGVRVRFIFHFLFFSSIRLPLQNGLLSWDRLRSTHSNKASSTGFLSEQDHMVYASVRY